MLLKIPKATVSQYVAAGMEIVPGVGHRCYPFHNYFYWGDGVWTSRIQALYQSYRLRNRTVEDVIIEIKTEIKEFQEHYNGTFEEVFGDLEDPYMLDEPDDYFNWRDALSELRKFHERRG